MKLQAIRMQNYQERKRLQRRMTLYQATPSSKPEIKQSVMNKAEEGKPIDDRPDKLEVEKKNAPSSPTAIPPPMSPPPQLDPEDRKRKIAALKVISLPPSISYSRSLNLTYSLCLRYPGSSRPAGWSYETKV